MDLSENLENETNEEKRWPQNSDLCLSRPLYERIDLTMAEREGRKTYLYHVANPPETIDAYCVECQERSTFRGFPVDIRLSGGINESLSRYLIANAWRCARDESHRMYFLFRCHEEMEFIVKIGQYPSVADLAKYEIQQYRQVLDQEKYKELSRAVGLAAHGVGIGAFVYLRRIFEDLIEEAHKAAVSASAEKKEPSWDESAYKKTVRVEEKIRILKEFLPPFLVENRKLYSILSKGVHSLSEEECLKYFDAVKVGIELILDEKLEVQRRERKIRRVETALGEIHQELREDSPVDANHDTE